MALSDVLAADRRRVALELLAEAPGGDLNEDVLRQGLGQIGHLMTRTDMRAVLQFLADHALVSIERLRRPSSGELWLAHLSDDGLAVALGHGHPGVARAALG